MACFADINVSQGSVAKYAGCGGIFDTHLSANLPGNFPVKKILKSVTTWQNCGHEFVAPVFWPTMYSTTWLSVLGYVRRLCFTPLSTTIDQSTTNQSSHKITKALVPGSVYESRVPRIQPLMPTFTSDARNWRQASCRMSHAQTDEQPENIMPSAVRPVYWMGGEAQKHLKNHIDNKLVTFVMQV